MRLDRRALERLVEFGLPAGRTLHPLGFGTDAEKTFPYNRSRRRAHWIGIVCIPRHRNTNWRGDRRLGNVPLEWLRDHVWLRSPNSGNDEQAAPGIDVYRSLGGLDRL